MQNKKWTIGIVNFHTADFMKYQLDILFSNNPNKEFNVIIVDNSIESEEEILLELIKLYSNIKICRNEASQEPWMRGSGQHGEGLDIILKETSTEYLLVHDPDFFWVKKNYLSFLEEILDSGCSCVGAPYRNLQGNDETGDIGPEDFPSAFGAAYRVSDISNLSFLPAVSQDAYHASNGVCWISKKGADVGWKMREKLASKEYFSFSQQLDAKLISLGSYSYETAPYKYFLDEVDIHPIGFHLFRGSFGSDLFTLTKGGYVSKTDSLSQARHRYGTYFRLLANTNQNESITNFIQSKIYIEYFANIKSLLFIDKVLDFALYKPGMFTILILSKLIYIISHPVGFIRAKFGL